MTGMAALNLTRPETEESSGIVWWPFVLGSIGLVVLVVACCWFIFIHSPPTVPKPPPEQLQAQAQAVAQKNEAASKRKSLWVLAATSPLASPTRATKWRKADTPKRQGPEAHLEYSLPALPEVRHVSTTEKMLALDDMMRAHLVNEVGQFPFNSDDAVQAQSLSQAPSPPKKAW